ncbi:hypothetical protein ONZ43_g1525 [Nemania bipapillata]|uniref:Uncharacterized protein n=1 Tax=Nemania bipapillata TaxID=110536 RepID=A0ACC2J413_9PEZI|nr:hypothetical protein ONZ43_g1525 [Nemania bipapillata]
MGCLLQAGVYREDDLFYSENLKKFDASQFNVPWMYRNEFSLDPKPNTHYFLHTHGITSKGDIFINGEQVASNLTQAGAYGGHEYDVSKLVDKKNTLLVRVHPTNYNYDLAIGFVDWNPYPPDNGTGIWRNIELKQTGSVALAALRVMTETNLPEDDSTAQVIFKSTARNLETREVTVDLKATVTSERGQSYTRTQTIKLGALQSKEVILSTTLKNPDIWWPKQWGKQPLYTGQVSVSVDGDLSDVVNDTFGVRQVTSKVNSHNDTIFYVNGLPFQVIGGGYSADMFLRWDSEKFTKQAQLTLDLGGNTIRLEGKNEQPELYKIADQLGLMVMAGWECCDKWEAWSYNEDLSVRVEWTEKDYVIANASMKHEALMHQNHPSMLAYLVGSDYWPNNRAAGLYDSAIKESGWQIPILASASKRSYPEILGPSGMKMDGPYDWTPPNYWYDVEPSEDRLGAAFGFGSELGAGVGTPELSSLTKFLTKGDMDDLWKNPNKGLYHMSTNVSSFYDHDYLLKAQMMDYEATRSQFEVFLRITLSNAKATLSRNVYWLSKGLDVLDWEDSDWIATPVTKYADYTALNKLQSAKVVVSTEISKSGELGTITLENKSAVPAFFIALNLVDQAGEDVLPVFWSDNYVTLWPHEKLELNVKGKGAAAVQIRGKNIEPAKASF